MSCHFAVVSSLSSLCDGWMHGWVDVVQCRLSLVVRSRFVWTGQTNSRCSCHSLKSNYDIVLHQIEAMRQKVNATDPAMCISALEWDSITLEQFKQANLWTTG